MRQCLYPQCTHGKGNTKATCTMHKLPSIPEKCRIWMMRCRVAGTPRKVPAAFHVCSCHFVGSHGPTLQNPHPIPFESPAPTKKPSVLKNLPDNVPYSEQHQATVQPHQLEKGDSFEVDDPNGSPQPVQPGSTIDNQSPGFVSQVAIPNAVSDLKTLLLSLEQFNVVPVIVDDSTMRAAGTPPPDKSQISKGTHFANIGELLPKAMTTNSFHSDCTERNFGKECSFESLLARSLHSFEVDKKDEGHDFNINKAWGKNKETMVQHPKASREMSIQCELAFMSYDKLLAWSDQDFQYFTGISKQSFEILYKFLGGDKMCSKIKYHIDKNTPVKEYSSTHSPKGSLLMTLVRLRRGYPLKDMEKFFNISSSSVSNIFTAWVKIMSIKFKSLENVMFVPVEVQEKNKPHCFKPFPNLRCIVDSTEIKIQKPKNFEQQSNTYSMYKGCNTAKFLVACSVYGGLSFISEGVEGNMSDRKLFLKSGILHHINAGEAVMVDRGFDIEADLNKNDIEIIIPPFLGDRVAFTEREMYVAKAVATTRIYIETLIGRIKIFRFLRYVVPNTLLDILSDVMRVCSVLCNFNDPFVRWEGEESDDIPLE